MKLPKTFTIKLTKKSIDKSAALFKKKKNPCIDESCPIAVELKNRFGKNFQSMTYTYAKIFNSKYICREASDFTYDADINTLRNKPENLYHYLPLTLKFKMQN